MLAHENTVMHGDSMLMHDGTKQISAVQAIHVVIAPVKIHILDPQTNTFHQPHPGAVQKAGHPPVRRSPLDQQGMPFGARESQRQSLRFPGAVKPDHPRQFDGRNLLVKKRRSRKHLIRGKRTSPYTTRCVKRCCAPTLCGCFLPLARIKPRIHATLQKL